MRRVPAIALVLLVVAVGVTAQTLEDFGYRVLDRTSVDGQANYRVRAANGQVLDVSYAGAFSAQRAEVLEEVRHTMAGIPGLRLDRLRVVFDAGRADIVAVPSTFRIDGRDVSENMPSGMQFAYTDFLTYDFRMRVDNLFLRLNGQFFTGEQFTQKIIQAVQEPALFVQSQDPQFLFSRLDALNQRLDELVSEDAANQEMALSFAQESRRFDRMIRSDLSQFEEETEDAFDDVAAEFQRVTAELAAAVDALTARLDELAAGQAAIRADLESYAELQAALGEEFDVARDGSVVLFTKSLFGAVKELDRDTIAAIVELRQAEKDLPYEEAATRVSESTGVEVDKKHVLAVYALYFNDYE